MEKQYEIAKRFAGQYCQLSPESIKAFAEIMEPLKLPKGNLFIKEGEIAHHIYYVEKGMVRQFYFKNKRDLTEHLSYEGNVVMCIESYLQQEPTRLMAETLEPSLIWRISKENFNRLTEERRDVEIFYRRIFEYSLIVSQHKADALRFENAHDRYRHLMRTHPEIIKRAPLIHIASYLQMTPETLSRVRSSILL